MSKRSKQPLPSPQEIVRDLPIGGSHVEPQVGHALWSEWSEDATPEQRKTYLDDPPTFDQIKQRIVEIVTQHDEPA